MMSDLVVKEEEKNVYARAKEFWEQLPPGATVTRTGVANALGVTSEKGKKHISAFLSSQLSNKKAEKEKGKDGLNMYTKLPKKERSEPEHKAEWEICLERTWQEFHSGAKMTARDFSVYLPPEFTEEERLTKASSFLTRKVNQLEAARSISTGRRGEEIFEKIAPIKLLVPEKSSEESTPQEMKIPPESVSLEPLEVGRAVVTMLLEQSKRIEQLEAALREKDCEIARLSEALKKKTEIIETVRSALLQGVIQNL